MVSVCSPELIRLSDRYILAKQAEFDRACNVQTSVALALRP
jgi:hypothetical protein